MTQMRNGMTPETAFIIEDSSGEFTSSIGELVEKMFGGNDGDYFVHSETTQETPDKSKRYKVLFVEDCNGKKHTVYFEIG